MTERIHKVNSLLEHEISAIVLRDFNFSSALVTVTHVDATANLIEAKAYISVLPDDKAAMIVAMLNKAVYDVQQKINKKLNMRPIPKLIFVKDEKLAEASRVEELLHKLKNEEK